MFMIQEVGGLAADGGRDQWSDWKQGERSKEKAEHVGLGIGSLDLLVRS